VALVGLLYLPLAASLLSFVRHQAFTADAQCTTNSAWLFPMGALREGLAGLAEGFGGALGLVAAAAAAAAGLVAWARRSPASLAVLAVPVAVQAVVSVAANVPLNPRYFVLAAPVLLLSIGTGVALLLERARAQGRAPAWMAIAGAIAALAVWGSPLARYYAVPKQDFAGALRDVRERAGPEDVQVAVHLAGRVYRDHFGAPFRTADTLADLLALEAEGRRVWVVATLERHLLAVRPDLHEHLHTAYRQWEVLPSTVRDAEMRLYVRGPTPR
jgi:hypothetical protein